jgi:hypothetical protein
MERNSYFAFDNIIGVINIFIISLIFYVHEPEDYPVEMAFRCALFKT